jgi:hypothetical protein
LKPVKRESIYFAFARDCDLNQLAAFKSIFEEAAYVVELEDDSLWITNAGGFVCAIKLLQGQWKPIATNNYAPDMHIHKP